MGEVSPEDFKKAKDQLLKNNAKILTMGALGALHGSVVVAPISMKIAAQLDIELKPSKTFT